MLLVGRKCVKRVCVCVVVMCEVLWHDDVALEIASLTPGYSAVL